MCVLSDNVLALAISTILSMLSNRLTIVEDDLVGREVNVNFPLSLDLLDK